MDPLNNQANPTSPGVAPQSPAPISDNKKHTFPKGLLVAVIVIVAGAAAAFAYQSFYGAKSLSALEIYKSAMNANQSVETGSVSFDAVISGSFSGKDIGAPADFKVSVKGSADKLDPADIRSSFNVALEASFDSATGTGKIKLALDTISIKRSAYVRFNDFLLSFDSKDPKAPSQSQAIVAMANGFASALRGKWISVDMSSSTIRSEANDEDVKAIKEYAKSAGYVESISMAGEEQVNGVDTYHIKGVFKDNGDLLALMKKSVLNNPKLSSDPRMGETLEGMAKLLSKEVSAEMWIGKSDRRLYRLLVQPISMTDDKTGTTMTMGIDATFKDYGKPMNIEAPQGAIPLEQLVQQLFGGMVAKPQTKAPVKR